LDFVPLRHCKNLSNRAALNHFLNVPAGFFVGIEQNMHLRYAAKQIVEIAHDVLVSAHHKNTEIIYFSGLNPMQRQRLLYVLQVDELADPPIRIAGNIHDRTVAIWWRSETMDGHDGKQLAERPVIEQRLEHRKIADVLIAQRRFELLHFVRHVAQATMHVDDLMRDLPINGVDLGLRFKIKQAEIESLLRFLLYLLDVV